MYWNNFSGDSAMIICFEFQRSIFIKYDFYISLIEIEFLQFVTFQKLKLSRSRIWHKRADVTTFYTI